MQYPLWVVNADLFVEYDSAGFVSKWLFDVLMLGKDVLFYGDADVVHCIGRDMQRLWRMEKDKDPTTAPFYHARLPVYSLLSGSVTSNMYHFDKHCVWIRTTSRWDKQVHLLLSPVRCCCVREASRTAVSLIRLYLLQLQNYVTYPAGHFEEMQNKNLGGFMPPIHMLWYLEKYFLDCGHADAVVVVDDMPAMAVRIAMSDESGRTKVVFLALSAIKQKYLANAVGGALQHAIIMQCMLEADQTERGATVATWDTQEVELLRGIPLWALNSSQGFEGHQKVHAAEAVQEQIVSEAPTDNSDHVAPAPSLPSQAKVKKTANFQPTQESSAGRGTPSSGKKPAKGKKKESDKPEESDNNNADDETEEEGSEQVLGTKVKRKWAPAAHFDASPDDSGKGQPKKKAKTAASAGAEFKPTSHSGAQPSRGGVASPSGTSTVARNLGPRLSKVAGPKKK